MKAEPLSPEQNQDIARQLEQLVNVAASRLREANPNNHTDRYYWLGFLDGLRAVCNTLLSLEAERHDKGP